MSHHYRFLSGLAVSTMLVHPVSQGVEPQRQEELDNLLVQDCGSCHGTRLKGGLGPPLTSQRMRSLPAPWIVEAIMAGREGTAMPPWRGLLTREEATWLARRLQTGALK